MFGVCVCFQPPKQPNTHTHNTNTHPTKPIPKPRNDADASLRSPTTQPPTSQFFSQSYESNLPTSLVCVVLSGQRLFTSETCCGFQYDYAVSSRAVFSLPFRSLGPSFHGWSQKQVPRSCFNTERGSRSGEHIFTCSLLRMLNIFRSSPVRPFYNNAKQPKVILPSTEPKTLPPSHAHVTKFIRVTAFFFEHLSPQRSTRILTRFPFARRGTPSASYQKHTQGHAPFHPLSLRA